jgi:hypothetical protein
MLGSTVSNLTECVKTPKDTVELLGACDNTGFVVGRPIGDPLRCHVQYSYLVHSPSPGGQLL